MAEVTEGQVKPFQTLANGTRHDSSDLSKPQLRASRIPGSRLPAPPSTQYGGLTELSDSQNNSRMQIPQPVSLKGIKRETPQPGTVAPYSLSWVVMGEPVGDSNCGVTLVANAPVQLRNPNRNERLLSNKRASIRNHPSHLPDI